MRLVSSVSPGGSSMCNTMPLQLHGANVKLAKISVEGNKRTKARVIRHAAKPVWEAKTFGQLMHALNTVQSRLQELDIFEGAQITVDTGDKDAPSEVTVTISVTEKSCTTLKTGTYVNAENAEGNMEGLYILRNYFGSAERFELSSAMGTSSSNNFKFDCHKPTIGSSDVSLHGQINRASMHNPHSSYHEIQTQVCVTLWPCHNWNLSVTCCIAGFGVLQLSKALDENARDPGIRHICPGDVRRQCGIGSNS
eukprot:COSAG05_NODE_100_length_19386_cov_396.467154_20_plen_252_part_00